MMTMIFKVLMLLVLCCGCERSNELDFEINKKIQPMATIANELRMAQRDGEPIPDSQEALERWVRERPSFKDNKTRLDMASEFFQRGQYLRNFRDQKGGYHEFLLLFVVETESGNTHEWICGSSSESRYGSMIYPLAQAKMIFGDVADHLKKPGEGRGNISESP